MGMLDFEDPEKWPEEEILKKSLDNPALFSILVERYREAFLRKSQHIVWSREEAEDVVQETFTKMYVHAEKFKKQEGIEFKSWAWRILVNTSLTHYRKLKRRLGDVGYLDEILEKGVDPKDTALEAELDRNTRASQLRTAIDGLPEEAAVLLRSHYLDDRPYEEIAKTRGITIGALKMKLFRARKVLKDTIGEI
jgi:RNA polymerase sigma-70 factor, ECF subfamily